MCKHIRNNQKNLQFQTYQTNGIIFTDLYYLLQAYNFKSNITIQTTEGQYSMVSENRLLKEISCSGFFTKKKYKSYVLQNNTRNQTITFKSIRQLLQILKTMKTSTFNITTMQQTHIPPHLLIKKLVRHSSILSTVIDKYSTFELTQAYKLVKNTPITNRYWQIANYRMAYIIKKKFGFIPRLNIIIRVPFIQCYPKEYIKQLFIQQLPKDIDKLKEHILRMNTKIIFTKRSTIGEMIFNYIPFAKNLVKKEIKYQCKNCEPIQITILSVTKTILNAKFIPQPTNFQIEKNIAKAINKTLYQNREYNFTSHEKDETSKQTPKTM